VMMIFVRHRWHPTSDQVENIMFSRKDFWRYTVTGFLGLAAVVISLIPGQERLIIAAPVAVVLAGVVACRPAAAITFMLVFLPLMGFIRRALISFAGCSRYDPLVLLAPFVAGILFIVSLKGSSSLFRSPLSRLVSILMIICIFQVANPVQGNMPVGLGGAIFFLTPLFWFFAGKRFLNNQLFTRLEKTVLLTGVFCGAYGLWQTFYGFFPFEQQWVDLVKENYVTLVAYGEIRAFSTFNSFGEFTNFMALILICCLAGLTTAGCRKNWLLAILGAQAVVVIIYSGIRGVVVMTILASLAVTVIKRKKFLKILPLLAVFLLSITFLIAVFRTIELPYEMPPLVKHLVGGLTDPLNPGKSSLVHHMDSFTGGLLTGISRPLGHGVGSTNLGGEKFGGVNLSSEVDVTDAFIALGWAGGLVYLAVVIIILFQAIKLFYQHKTSPRYLAVLWGLLFLGGQWLNGGNYYLTSLVWMVAGWLDNEYLKLNHEQLPVNRVKT